MKIKEIAKRLDAFGPKFGQKSKKKQIKTLNKILAELEQKNKKFQAKLSDANTEDDRSRYQRKISVTEAHASKALAYKQQLEQS